MYLKTEAAGFATTIVCLTYETEIVHLFSSFRYYVGLMFPSPPSLGGMWVSFAFITLLFPVGDIAARIVSFDVASFLKNFASMKCDSTTLNGLKLPFIIVSAAQ